MNPRPTYLNSRPGQARPHGATRRQVLKLLAVAAGTAALIAFLVGSWFYWKLRGSLPQLDGSAAVPGLAAPVKIERDGQGVPTVTGQSYLDVCRALGFAHGQDRFFQMDLSRRRGAGELAEIFGKAALPLDRRARIHDFRPLAAQALKAMPADQRAALEAYTAGVNAGLASLKVKPFEYVVLRVKPAAWKAEDCVLVGYSMALTLQDDQGQYLRTLHRLRVTLGEKAVDYFSPRVGPMDAALDGSVAELPAMPGPTVINLRGKVAAVSSVAVGAEGGLSTKRWERSGTGAGDSEVFAPVGGQGTKRLERSATRTGDPAGRGGDGEPRYLGSNAFAVAGPVGGAVLANDMHLTLNVPNTWYRASLVYPGHRVTGVTLPGTPAVVAGSNGKIAWGLTVAEAGAADLILVNTDEADFYRGPDADEYPIKPHASVIAVKGGDDVTVSTDWTVWGPIVSHEENNQLLVYHWAMDDASACDFGLMHLMDAGTVAEATEVARHTGMVNMNFVVADASGQIGWTVLGKLPKRVGFNGRWAVLFQYRDRKWDGWLNPADVPVVTGRNFLWSANQRMLGGAALEKLGDGGYARGARAAQIRDDLAALTGPQRTAAVAPADLLKIELDDRATFLGWWRDLALHSLEPGPARDAVEHDAANAAVESKGYRFVREFRARVAQAVFEPLFAACAEDDANFDWARLNYEPALREMLTKKPIHLLDPKWEGWDDLVKFQAKAQAKRLATWGSRNQLHMVHPLSLALPAWMTGWLNMPAVPLPGDSDLPRVQSPSRGASERFAVSPGHEDQGIFEMPGGQSGHPLSPYYAAGHENWVQGKASPFLPGTTAHTLMLQPE